MATETAVENNRNNLWSGGRSPFKSSYGKVMMWYFLLSDAFTFAAFLITYGTIRYTIGQENWPMPNQVFDAFPGFGHAHLPLMFVSLMTFILIMSSVTMVRAVQEGHQMNQKGVAIYILLTIVGGIAFLSCQAWEWYHLIEGGMTLTNPFQKIDHETGEVLFTAPVVFGQLFYTITGFHGFHVTTGVVLNIILLANVLGGTYQRRGHYEMVEKIGLYWHFVDLVWVFVFLCFYLL